MISLAADALKRSLRFTRAIPYHREIIATFITKLGGVLACRQNADRVLEAGELLGVLPEGIEGAFSLYRDAYKLASFRRDDFLKMALRHRVPIIPFVIVGNAEILPMFARIKSHW